MKLEKFEIENIVIEEDNMMGYTVDIIKGKEKWDYFLSEIGEYDFYHTYDYHQISIEKDETAVLFVYTEGKSIIAIPFVVRPIKNSEYYDITSVYGYAGPISINVGGDWDNSKMRRELDAFFDSHKIVSVFSRLNPYISNQEIILDKLGTIDTIGPVVNIDLTKSLDEQRAGYSNITKRYLKKSEKLFSFKFSNKREDILKFIDLYYENMIRVNASKKYFFDHDYFFNIINAEGFETDILFATLKETNEIISAAMMTRANDKIVQYHVSGTRNDYLKLTPMRYLIDKMRVFASEKGYKYFNLGGGLGNKKDSLLQFKSTFSKDFRDFKVWKIVCNQEVYDKLSAHKKDEIQDSNKDFFPQYRL